MKNDPKELSQLMGQVEALLISNSVGDSVIYQVNLILEEILTNIIKYAYQDENAHEILVHLHLEDDLIRIHFEDDGVAFDPRQAAEPDLDRPLEEIRIGGLGLHLVRANAERIEYKREGTKNRLTIRLRPTSMA
jgi:anti-sigma regulatory factor (Ser/Thr protein kinase)